MSDRHPREIAFVVPGWRPLRNEATSMLAAHHRQAERVRMLLRKAAEAASAAQWTLVNADIAITSPEVSARR